MNEAEHTERQEQQPDPQETIIHHLENVLESCRIKPGEVTGELAYLAGRIPQADQESFNQWKELITGLDISWLTPQQVEIFTKNFLVLERKRITSDGPEFDDFPSNYAGAVNFLASLRILSKKE